MHRFVLTGERENIENYSNDNINEEDIFKNYEGVELWFTEFQYFVIILTL